MEKQTTLTHLSLSDNDINHKRVKDILELPSNVTLQILDLRWNNIGDNGAKHLFQLFNNNKFALKRLDLCSNNVSNEGMKYVYEVIENNTKLDNLNLKCNIESKGVEYKFRLSKEGCTIFNHLNIEWQNLEYKKIKCFSNKALDFTWKKIREEDINYLTERLKNNTALKKLDLTCESIESKCVTRLFECLKLNATSLQNISLCYKATIDCEEMDYIVDYIKSNTALRILRLNWSNIQNEGVKRLSDGIKSGSELSDFFLL